MLPLPQCLYSSVMSIQIRCSMCSLEMTLLYQRIWQQFYQRRTMAFTGTNFHFIVFVLVTTSFIIPAATGGSCWADYDPATGKCVALVYRNVSREACCSRSGFSYTTREMTYEEVFRAIVTEGGVSRCVPCSSYKGDVCAEINCGRDQHCIARNLQPRCVCHPNCSDVTTGEPVCATNGRDYSDECHFRMVRCRRKLNIEVAYHGRCQDSCENVECSEGRCIEDEYGIPHCLNCQEECLDDEELGPVCGMNNYTYESKCHLRLTSCANDVAIGLSYHGRCKDSLNCSTFLCMEGRVCAMDTIPHCSECDLKECNYHSLLKICGSDDKTYSNICEMKRQICQSREFVTQKHIGPCAGDISNNRKRLDSETFFRHYLDFIRYEQQSQASTTHFDRTVLNEEEATDVELEEVTSERTVYEEKVDVVAEDERAPGEEDDHHHHSA